MLRIPALPRPSRTAALALAAACAPALAHAQAYNRIAPREPAPSAAPSLTAPPTAHPAPASNTVIIPMLKGLVFVPGTSALRPGGMSASGIAAQGLPLLDQPGFTRQVSPYLNQPLTFADLNAIARAADAWYRTHGHPFVSINVPPQNVSTGTVQVVVTEYRLGTVRVEGNHWFSSALLRQESGLTTGQALQLGDVSEDLSWLNSNPFRTVNAVFQPGAAPGQTDVVLQTKDRLPVHVYTTFDNQGVPTLGRGEWGVGGTWGNVGGLDQILSYQFTRSISGRYNAHSLSWTVPLPWRDKLVVFGSYATERPALDTNFDETGHSGQASLRYVHTLPELTLGQGQSLQSDLQLGYDFKTTNTNLEFGGVRVFGSEAEIDQFPVIYDAALSDPYGQTAFSNQLVLSPGGMTGANNDTAFKTLVPGSSASYVYDTISLTRTTVLPAKFSWTARVQGQVANQNLMYSEQLGLGGIGTVRGYFTDTALGSEGVLVSNEIRGPAFSLSKLTHLRSPVADTMQLGVFWDYGHTAQVHPIPDAINEADLSSVGLDLNTTLDRYVDLTFDVGWRLRAAPQSDKHGGFGDISLVVGY